MHRQRRVGCGKALAGRVRHLHARQEHAQARYALRIEQLLRGCNVGVDEAPVHVRHAGRERALHAHVHRIQRTFSGTGQQGQTAAGLGLEALGQTFTEHDFRVFAATGQNFAGGDGQKRAFHGKLAIGVDAGGHHHRGLFAIADQATELHARQHLAHLRVGQQLRSQFLRVVQTMLQGCVLVLVELIGLANDQMPGAARRHLRQTPISRQCKAARHQNRGGTQRGDRHRHQ